MATTTSHLLPPVDEEFRAITVLARAGKFDEAVARLQARLKAQITDHAAWHQLSRIEAQRRRNLRALKAARRAATLAPGNVVYQRWFGLALANVGAGREAMAILAPIVEANADDYLAMHALHIACYKAGDIVQTLTWGERMLALEDRMQTPRKPPPGLTPPPPAARTAVRRKLIAFSLWGAKPVYNVGAIINARLAPYIYPGWITRFYLAADVPAATRQALTDAGAQVIDAWRRHPGVSPSMWRFLPADDPDVSAFICRDCDARLSPKEAAAVDAWLAGGKQAHVMRDHVIHRNVMLAGMWGARNQSGHPLFMRRRLQRFLKGQADARHGADQHFLAKEIWPALRDDCCVHDSYYTLFNAQRFPVMGKGNDRFHVGMGVTNEAAIQREARLLGVAWPAVAADVNG